MTTSASSSSSLGPALTAIMKYAEDDPNTSESMKEYINWMKICTTGKPRRRDHIKSTPLFELSTICINVDSILLAGRFSRGFQLYGHVKFIDDNDTEFHLFHRTVHDALDVYVDLASSYPPFVILLRGSDHTRPHWLPKLCSLDVFLKDKLTDMVIVEDVIDLDFTSKVVYDKEQECDLGRALPAKLTYIVHSYAVIASVDCTLLKKDHDDHDDDTSVGSDDFGYATIAARYMGRNKQHVSRILLSNDKLSLDVSRTFWLAVPAYSPMLKLQVNLSGVDYRSDDSLEFVVCDDTIVPYTKDIVVGKWLIRLSVTWRHAFDFYILDGKFYLRDCHFHTDLEKASLVESDIEFSESEEEIDGRALGKKILEDILVLGKRKTLLSSIEDPPLDKRISSIYSSFPLHLVEVFSIAIFSYDDDDPITLSADSSIKVDDTIGSHDMLSVVRPLVRPWNILRVNDPSRRCFLGHDSFEMELDLKDVRGREISKGYLIWDYHSVNNWHDRRICSVVPGNDGFAAVHYTIFEDAVQARVKAVFTGDDDRGCVVMGRICCRYTRYRYFTSYERRYYQSVLFERNESEDFALLLSDGHEVPLSKSVVCVPVDTSLIVKVELRVVVDGCVEKLRGRLLYNADEEAKETKFRSQPQSIKGSKYGVSVFVEWGTGPDDDFCLGDPKPN